MTTPAPSHHATAVVSPTQASIRIFFTFICNGAGQLFKVFYQVNNIACVSLVVPLCRHKLPGLTSSDHPLPYRLLLFLLRYELPDSSFSRHSLPYPLHPGMSCPAGA